MVSRLLKSPVPIFILLAVLFACSVKKPESEGTSLVVLVDFSKSFAPLYPDERALNELSAATSELAQREWHAPVSVLWSRIQSASLVSNPLCGPLQFQQSLIKRDDEDSAQIADKLQACAKTIVQAAAIPSEQALYTDISGAIALAVEQGRSTSGTKYLVVLSDFIEDLPPGKQPVKLQLNGEHVLLLHRMGTDRTPLALVDHLSRIRRWTDGLRQSGAASVLALPLNSVTQQRLMRALDRGNRSGTDVVVLQDLPDTARPDMLRSIASALKKAAPDWESPVTVTWADMRNEPAPPWQMPPLEFMPRLIKASAAPSAPPFPVLLDESAAGMQRFSPGARYGDIAGSLSFYASAGTLDANHVFLIVSAFPNPAKEEQELSLNLRGIKVVMLPAPNREDAADESAYLSRIDWWEKWLKVRQANVCRISFNGLTANSLIGCMQ